MDIHTNLKTTQDLFDTFPDTILLVGNGDIKSKLGAVIDEFECVIRFNKFIINGYEDSVGTKISAISFPVHNLNHNHRYLIPIHDKYASTPTKKSNTHLFTLCDWDDVSSFDILKPWKGSRLISTKHFREHINYGLSSGCSLALNLSLLWNKNIFLVGFDFFTTGHIFNTSHQHSNEHSGVMEYNIIKNIKNIKLLEK
jgi:hypothetical protein